MIIVLDQHMIEPLPSLKTGLRALIQHHMTYIVFDHSMINESNTNLKKGQTNERTNERTDEQTDRQLMTLRDTSVLGDPVLMTLRDTSVLGDPV